MLPLKGGLINNQAPILFRCVAKTEVASVFVAAPAEVAHAVRRTDTQLGPVAACLGRDAVLRLVEKDNVNLKQRMQLGEGGTQPHKILHKAEFSQARKVAAIS